MSKIKKGGDLCLAEVGQSFMSGKLTWYSSFRCPSCGKATEIDGDDDIPNEIREAILEQE